MTRTAFVPLALLASILLSMSATAEGLRRPESVDLVELEQPADPRVSPDGRSVAYLVRSHDAEAGRGSGLWLATDGEGPGTVERTQVMEPSRQVSSPRWSPDGRLLAFLAGDEEGRRILYGYKPVTGELAEMAPAATGVRAFDFSPDGRWLALLRRTPKAEERESDAIVVGERPDHVRLWLLDRESGEVSPLSRPDRTVWHFGFSPDGKKVAVLASESPIAEGHEYGSHLSVLTVPGGEETVLTTRTNAQADPTFSPDGAWVAYLAPPESVGGFKERGTVHVVPAAGGTPRALLEDYPGNAWDVRWHPRRNVMIVGLARGTENLLAEVAPDGQVTARVSLRYSLIPYWTPMFSLSADGETVAYLSEETSGTEVFKVTGSGEPRRLTSFGDQLAGVALGEVEAVSWINPKDGARVEGVVVHPAHGAETGETDEGGKAPLVVILHGGPAYNWGLGSQLGSRAQLWSGRGYRVLLPNFRGSSGSGLGWLTSNVRDWGHGPMGDVMSGVDHLIAEGQADPARLFLDGGSYGGYLGFWILGHSDRFRAAFLRAGIADLATEYALTDEPSFLVGYFSATPYEDPEIYRQSSPLTYAGKVKTPLLMIHGENDLRVPVSESRRFHDALVHHGATSRLVIYPGEGHGIRRHANQLDLMARALEWFAVNGGSSS